MGDTSHLSLFWCIFHCFLLQLVALSIGPWQNQPRKLSTCWDGLVPHHRISHNPHIWMQSPVLHKPIGLDAGPMSVKAVHHLVWCARPLSPQVQLMCPPWLGLPCVKSKNIKEILVLSYRFGCFIVLHTKVISKHGYGNMLVATLKWPGQNVHCACGRGKGFGRLSMKL
jgi:hypothetical protein